MLHKVELDGKIIHNTNSHGNYIRRLLWGRRKGIESLGSRRFYRSGYQQARVILSNMVDAYYWPAEVSIIASAPPPPAARSQHEQPMKGRGTNMGASTHLWKLHPNKVSKHYTTLRIK